MTRRLAIVSYPADAAADADRIKRAISDFNDLVDDEEAKFDYLDWNENLATGRAARGQEVVNAELARCDLILAVFRNRLGTPTGGFASGTVEEIHRFLERPTRAAVDFSVHVFFNDSAASPSDMVPENLAGVRDFKTTLSGHGVLYKVFKDQDRLEHGVRLALKKYNSSIRDVAVPRSEGRQTILDSSEMEDLGIFDALDLGNAAITDASDLVEKLGQLSSRAASRMKAVTEKATGAQGLSRDLISEIAAILRDDAAAVGEIGTTLPDTLVKAHAYHSRAASMAMEDFDPSAGAEGLSMLSTAIDGAVQQLDQLIDSMSGQTKSSGQMPRLTKELNVAKRASNNARSELVEALRSFSEDMKDLMHQLNDYCSKAQES